MASQLNIGVFGMQGRMGNLIAQQCLSTPNVHLVGGTCRDLNKKTTNNCPRLSLNDLVERSDVLIDFTHPEGLATHIHACLQGKKPLMVGTTGLDDAHHDLLKSASQRIPVVYAPNTSLGITLLMSLIEKAAQVLGPEHDIEILETHHRHKIDAPSGTALALGEVAAKARGKDAFQLSPSDRYLKREKREVGGIGYASLRGGNVAGEHAVHFFSDFGHLHLTYGSNSPQVYAEGAVKAAQWLVDKNAGLYSMRNVLGL